MVWWRFNAYVQLSPCHSGSQVLSWYPSICTVFLFTRCHIENHKHCRQQSRLFLCVWRHLVPIQAGVIEHIYRWWNPPIAMQLCKPTSHRYTVLNNADSNTHQAVIYICVYKALSVRWCVVIHGHFWSDRLPRCLRRQFGDCKALQSSLQGIQLHVCTSLHIFQKLLTHTAARPNWSNVSPISKHRPAEPSTRVRRLKRACAYRVRPLKIANEETDVRPCKIQDGDYRCTVNQHLRQGYRCTVKQPRRL